MVSVASLARQFALAGDLVHDSLVAPRMGAAIRGRLEAGLLFTPAYVARVKAQVRLSWCLLLMCMTHTP